MIVVSETDQGERFGVTQKVQWGGNTFIATCFGIEPHWAESIG